MEVRLGAEAIGKDGSLGHIARFFMDPKYERAEQMTIKHPLGIEHVVPLLSVTRVESDKVYVDLDKAQVDAAERFDERSYRAPGLHISTEPDWQNEIGTPPLYGSQTGETVSPPDPAVQRDQPGSPEPEFTPEDEQEPVISRDTNVLDRDGRKAGKVGRFVVDNLTGKPLALALREGTIISHEVDVPLDLVQEYGPEGILLKTTRDQIKWGAAA